jgi:hypothetical protein
MITTPLNDTTLMIAVAELLEQGKISKRTNVEIDSVDYEEDNIPYTSADEVRKLAVSLSGCYDEQATLEHLELYNSGVWDYMDWDNYEPNEEDE